MTARKSQSRRPAGASAYPLVLVHGLKKRVIRVGRFGGQYAKPRSADTETCEGVTLPSYRGDMINGLPFTEEARVPDPLRLLRGYERSALTLNSGSALRHSSANVR